MLSARCENLLDSYGKCMQYEPRYIPRKFRNDKYHVMNADELNSVQKVEDQRFRSECEILRIRKDTCTSNLFGIDQEISDFINSAPVTLGAQQMLIDRWNKCVNEDIERITLKWKKKMSSTEVAIKKDRDYLLNHLKARVPLHCALDRGDDICTIA